MQNNNQWYDPNNVNADNFNITMKGYFKKTLNNTEEELILDGFDSEQIQNIKRLFKISLNNAIDMMTMEEARKYYNK